MTDAKKLVNEYLSAFYAGDFARAGTHVAEDFRFKGPFVDASDKRAFFESAGRLAPIVRGYDMLHQWQEDNDVCSIFDLRLQTPLGSGSVTCCEWHTVRDGALVAGRVILDTAAFRTLVSPAR
ncbi:MAG: hypothetical protein JWO36_2648 [Myxococcales bacterium]|nr:hypothetical protein [Myxococcales bacterium]